MSPKSATALTFTRCVSHEILDGLAPSDARAVRSRRDLLRINRIMGAPGILARAMRPIIERCSARPPLRILELGAGDGRVMLGIARKVACSWPVIEMTFLDQLPLIETAVCGAFVDLGWSVRPLILDVRDWMSSPTPSEPRLRWDLIVTNLFLHHLDHLQLPLLLAAIAARCNAFLACEPRRTRLSLAGSRLIGATGASWVTRHDAVLSVQAGFRGCELASMWPSDRDEWQLQERKAGLFSHLFQAERRCPPSAETA